MSQHDIKALLNGVLASVQFLSISGCGFSCLECAKAPANVTDEDRRGRGAAESLLVQRVARNCYDFCESALADQLADAGTRVRSVRCADLTGLGADPKSVSCVVRVENVEEEELAPIVVDARSLVEMSRREVAADLAQEGGGTLESTTDQGLEACRTTCKGAPAAEKWRAADQGATSYRCELDGVDIVCTYSGICEAAGRRPPGLLPETHEGRGADAIGLYWARAAYLEEASVAAFLHLAVELDHHAAPRSLVRRVRAAARDEVRHARLCLGQAIRHRGQPLRPRIRKHGCRDLLAIGVDNAVEGCVKETYAALQLLHRAEHARDPRDAAIFASIGRDEVRHAQLSWDLDAWIRGRAGIDARRIDDVRAEAIAKLVSDVSSLQPRDVRVARSRTRLVNAFAHALTRRR